MCIFVHSRAVKGATMETKINQSNTPDIRMLRLPEVIDRTGLSKATIYEQIAAGTFPQPVNLGPRAVGFVESEVGQWLRSMVEASRVQKRQAEEYRQYRELTAF